VGGGGNKGRGKDRGRRGGTSEVRKGKGERGGGGADELFTILYICSSHPAFLYCM
jgi:hypothetical protein